MSVPPTVPFVVLFQGRCGSSYLMGLLDSRPDVRAWPEWMPSAEEGAGAQLAWARGALSPERGEGLRAAGFKTKLRDVAAPDAFSALLGDLGARVLFLRRRNRVKLVVSFIRAVELAERTGRWNRYGGHAPTPPGPIDPDRFAAWLRQAETQDEALRTYVAEAGPPVHTLAYEDLLADRDAALRGIERFLGLPPGPVQASTLKNTSDDLRDVVTNLDVLRRAYAGTRYEPMFDEVGT